MRTTYRSKPFHLEGRTVKICGGGKTIIGYVEFVDDTGTACIELQNGKHICLTAEQYAKQYNCSNSGS